MLNFIDISNWQAGFDPASAPVDGVIAKATEGTTYVDPYCDGFVQKAKNAGKLWGFYHFAGSGNATAEADFFVKNCKNYFGEGVPVLDWEGNQSVAWVNEFVKRVHDLTQVWVWIYGNPWRFNQGGVEQNCARWIASYPAVAKPSHATARTWKCPNAAGNVVAWQFASDCPVAGWHIDGDLFYGDSVAWKAYAHGDRKAAPDPAPSTKTSIFEDQNFKVTVEVK